MYVDKPMQGHDLMQAIARVNRVFRDKPGGLVVDYPGLADQIKQALATYTDSGSRRSHLRRALGHRRDAGEARDRPRPAPRLRLGQADKRTSGTSAERLGLIPAGQEHILAQEDGKKRFVQVVTELSRAFALCAASDTRPRRSAIT
jgi:type I restriction enzyme R subunit